MPRAAGNKPRTQTAARDESFRLHDEIAVLQNELADFIKQSPLVEQGEHDEFRASPHYRRRAAKLEKAVRAYNDTVPLVAEESLRDRMHFPGQTTKSNMLAHRGYYLGQSLKQADTDFENDEAAWKRLRAPGFVLNERRANRADKHHDYLYGPRGPGADWDEQITGNRTLATKDEHTFVFNPNKAHLGEFVEPYPRANSVLVASTKQIQDDALRQWTLELAAHKTQAPPQEDTSIGLHAIGQQRRVGKRAARPRR